jgi:hypothetical protein
MVIPVSYSTGNQLTRNCPTENSKIGKCQNNIYQRTYKARFLWQKEYIKLSTSSYKILEQRILWKRQNI